MNKGIIKNAMNIVMISEVVIRFLIWEESSLSTAAERSGISAVESEPTIVIGMNKRGIVIPIATP